MSLWQNSKTVYDVLAKDCPATEAVADTSAPGVKVLPSHISLAGADLELNVIGREKILRDKLRPLAGEFDYILIDCSSSIGVLTLNALCAAHSVIVTLQAEYLALEGMSQLINTLELVRQRLEWPVEFMGALITFYDQRKLLCQQVARRAEEHFKGQVFRTKIRDNVKLAEAPSHGIPAMLYDPVCHGTEDYRNLTQEVMDYVETRTRRQPIGAVR